MSPAFILTKTCVCSADPRVEVQKIQSKFRVLFCFVLSEATKAPKSLW